LETTKLELADAKVKITDLTRSIEVFAVLEVQVVGFPPKQALLFFP